MATTFLILQDDLLAEIALDGDSDTRTKIKRFLNESYRRISAAYPWPELRTTARLVTVAPYKTGTVAVTNGSATVTGTGTAFSTAGVAAGQTFALGYGQPVYTIDSVDSETQITLTETYREADSSGETYTIFKDTFSLASDVDELDDRSLILLSPGNDYPMRWQEDSHWARADRLPTGEGFPFRFRRVDNDSSGNIQIQVSPVPDDVYAIEYAYQKMPADMSSDSDQPALRESLRYLIRMGAREDAFRLNSEHQKALVERQVFQQELARAWSMNRQNKPGVIVREAFDANGVRGVGRYRVNPWG